MLISLFFFGNPDRGDDGVGEVLYHWALDYFSDPEKLAPDQKLRFINDFQLEPEHIFDLDGCDYGIFIDCHADTDKVIQWKPVAVGNQLMFSSHSVTAESLLFLFENTLKKPAPPCYLLGIRGEDFGLGRPISSSANKALEQAKLHLAHRLKQGDFS